MQGLAPEEYLTITGVSGHFPAGQHSFGVDCNEFGTADMQYREARVVAVALSGE